MSLLLKLSGGLAQSLRRPFVAYQQGAAYHLSAVLEARSKDASSKDSDSESDAEEANPNPGAQASPEQPRAEWDIPFDATYVRNPDGSMPDKPLSELVEVNNGEWDVFAKVSPALAAALEAAPGEEDKADALFEALHEVTDMLSKGKTPKGDGPASDDDLRVLAEAIDLYFAAAPEADPEVDTFEEFDRGLLGVVGDTIKEVLDGGARSIKVNMAPPGRLPWEILEVDEEAPMVNWGVDLTGGKAEDPWKAALLSEDAKEEMWSLHTKQGWSAEELAEHFGIRQQRALAILALKEREHKAKEAGVKLHTEAAEAMEEAWGAHEVMGARERHHVSLPSFPNYRELTEADADKLASLLEKLVGKRFEDIELEDMTPEITQQLLATAGMDQGAVEEELAVKEEEDLVAEFRRNLEYNMRKTGASLSRSSRKSHPPQRPEGGWSLLVKPLGKAARSGEQQAYVAAPDGSMRELTADEQLHLERQQPRPRSKLI